MEHVMCIVVWACKRDCACERLSTRSQRRWVMERIKHQYLLCVTRCSFRGVLYEMGSLMHLKLSHECQRDKLRSQTSRYARSLHGCDPALRWSRHRKTLPSGPRAHLWSAQCTTRQLIVIILAIVELNSHFAMRSIISVQASARCLSKYTTYTNIPPTRLSQYVLQLVISRWTTRSFFPSIVNL